MTRKMTHALRHGGNPDREADEARFRKLFEDAEAMSIQGYLPDGTVVYWNRASEKIYGYTAEEALGRSLLDLIIPAGMRDEVAAAVRWMFESGRGIPPGRLNLRHKDGHAVAVYSSHTVVAVPGQQPVLFCLDADMSHLERAESELRVAAAAFETQQSMVITDARGVILRINQAFTEATGYTAEEAVGQTPRLIKSDRHPPDFYAAMWRQLIATGLWQGEIWDRRKNGEVYLDWVTITAVRDERGQVTNYVGAQTDISHRKEAEAKIMRLAFYDPLTHLPNRRLLLDRLQQAVATTQRKGGFGALLFIDLDHFKTLNDTQGHDIGDLLLQQVAERLGACTRDSDTAARLGGDEFMLMLEDLSSGMKEAATQAETVGGKILAALAQPCILKDHEYTGSASIGITLFGSQACQAEELMKQADLALYEAKAAGRNTLRFFDPEMQAAVTLRATLLGGLREALRRRRFELHYQPQVDGSGRIVGAEALIRWHCPERGMVSPAAFIPVAEESGLIHAIGQWVLETACAQLAAWAAQPQCAGLTLAVNVSASQFSRGDFAAQVVDTVQRSGADPRRLRLELTESLLVERLESVAAKMAMLKEFGVGFALDDFGTGYSSLAYLRRLPLDELKIDQSFVRDLLSDPHCAAIARTIIVLGQTMGFSVIAEGVENEEQRALLADLGCHAYQGYLYGRPQPAQALTELLARQAAP